MKDTTETVGQHNSTETAHIAIHCIQHSQAMLERGVCELAHSFFHYISDQIKAIESIVFL